MRRDGQRLRREMLPGFFQPPRSTKPTLFRLVSFLLSLSPRHGARNVNTDNDRRPDHTGSEKIKTNRPMDATPCFTRCHLQPGFHVRYNKTVETIPARLMARFFILPWNFFAERPPACPLARLYLFEQSFDRVFVGETLVRGFGSIEIATVIVSPFNVFDKSIPFLV